MHQLSNLPGMCADLPATNSADLIKPVNACDPYLCHRKSVAEMGGTMRLGSYPCKTGYAARKLSAEEHITERHRHRYG